jgi:beta-lactamase regulating signal transducer with metallopeptidase domain
VNWQTLGSAALKWALWNSAGAGVVFIVVLTVLKAVGHRISARWRHNLWMLVAVRLVMPAIPGIGLSLPEWPRVRVETKAVPVSFHLPPYTPMVVPEVVPHAVGVLHAAEPDESKVSDGSARNVEVGADAEPATWSPVRAPTEAQSARMPVMKVDQPSASSARAAGVQAVGANAGKSGFRWGLWLLFAWLVGAGVVAAWLLGRMIQLWIAMRKLKPVDDEGVLEVMEECRGMVGLRKAPALVVGRGDFGPALMGVWRPRWIVPAEMLSGFGRQDLRAIFLHELVHQRRGDVGFNYLIAGLQALHWFNPLVWMAFAQVRAERELACDEGVLSLSPSRERLAYGCTILKLLESACGNAGLAAGGVGAVGVIGNQALIHRRIDMIARFDRSRQGRSAAAMVLAVIVGAAALTATSRAQDKPAAAPAKDDSASDHSIDSARGAIEAAGKPGTKVDSTPAAADPNVAGRPRVDPFTPGTAKPEGGIGIDPVAPTTAAAAPTPALEPTQATPPILPPARSRRANEPAMGVDFSPRIIEDASAAKADATTAERLKHTHPLTSNGLPLRDVLRMIADVGKLDIVIDDQALADANIDPNVAVNMMLNEPRPLEQILEMSLRLASPQIDYSILNGVLFISSRAQLNQRVVTRVYDVGGADHSALNDLLINGTGLVPRVSYVGDKLVITASELTQRHVAKLLAAVADQMSAKGEKRQTSGRGMGPKETVVRSLYFADAQGLKPLLLTACSPNFTLAVDARTNSLIITAAADDQKLAEELIRKLDLPGNGEQASGRSTGDSQQIDAIVSELASLRVKYGEGNPQVKQLEARLKAATEQLAQRPSTPAAR